MELSKEKMLEIAERKEKCVKCDTEKHICIACDNFVCANKVWREEIAFYEQIREMMQANAEGRLLVLPCKVGDAVFEIIEETVPNHYFYIVEYQVQDVSVKALKYADDWYPLDDENLYFTREEAEAELEKIGGVEK